MCACTYSNVPGFPGLLWEGLGLGMRADDLDSLGRQSNGELGGAAGVRGGAVVIGHHARREANFGVYIPIDQGQTDELVPLNGPAQYRVRQIDGRRRSREI